MSDLDSKSKMRLRRVKANGRERQRMHGLNHALDILRQYVPLTTQHQKLSKIETLRLARNYIAALQRMLQTGCQPTPLEYAHQLSTGLSQTTTNMLANLLQVQPRMLLGPSVESSFTSTSVCQTNPIVYPPSTPCSVPPYYYDRRNGSDSSFDAPLSYPYYPHNQ